jgi:uroporphyrinogen-III synthase
MNLENKRVLITRPRAQAGPFATALEDAGAEAIPFPVIEIRPLSDTSALDRALNKLCCYEWLVLTSVNGVEAVWERLQALGLEREPPQVKVAAIGPRTAGALEARGVPLDFVPEEYVAEAILPGLGDINDCWVLLPRADGARPALPRAIQRAGGIAHEITAYHTLPAEPDSQGMQALQAGVDIVTFTSSSTVRNFIALSAAAGLDARALPGSPIFACIGPITASTAREEGLPVALVAEEYTTEGLLSALQDF